MENLFSLSQTSIRLVYLKTKTWTYGIVIDFLAWWTYVICRNESLCDGGWVVDEVVCRMGRGTFHFRIFLSSSWLPFRRTIQPETGLRKKRMRNLRRIWNYEQKQLPYLDRTRFGVYWKVDTPRDESKFANVQNSVAVGCVDVLYLSTSFINKQKYI